MVCSRSAIFAPAFPVLIAAAKPWGNIPRVYDHSRDFFIMVSFRIRSSVRFLVIVRFLNCPRSARQGLAIDWSPRLPGGYYCSLRTSTKLRNFTSLVASGSSVSSSIGPQAASTITSSLLIRKSSLRQALVLSVENYERQDTLASY